MWVGSLGQEDSMEKEMATHSSILAWKIPWTEEPGGLQSTGSQESDTTKGLSTNSDHNRFYNHDTMNDALGFRTVGTG